MMPLAFADPGLDHTVKKINGNVQMRQHLADMGFAEGTTVKVVSRLNGSLIVNVKNTRIAIGESMAMRIMV
ncbi:MAG: FeoA family protein [Lactimicrobium sp.]|jgi:ferrous iron transport protein A|uniref:FeoA family protein n=1 Tax=Lactimicrobium sp. TaxID=2563780 RepID=UPI002F35D6C3